MAKKTFLGVSVADELEPVDDWFKNTCDSSDCSCPNAQRHRVLHFGN